MSAPIHRIESEFIRRVAEGDFPPAPTDVRPGAAELGKRDLFELFESQLKSRQLDLTARRLGKEKRGYYSIGGSGHEGNVVLGRAFTTGDMAFLHYRSGALLIERAGQSSGQTPLWDMMLSLVAAAEDPVSGGRHKVLGSKTLLVPPQTSTIASHLPKAVGAAYSIALARTHKRSDAVMPRDAVVLCSFGDASANHSTAQGAFNAAAWTAFKNAPLPIVFVCEDNGVGISVPTPDGWIRTNFENRPGLAYMFCDGRDMRDAWRGARAAEGVARRTRRPVFLHMKTVRLMGHAGSDVESAYRAPAAIAAAEGDDPLVHSARILIEEGVLSADDVLALNAQIAARVERIAEEACARPKLTTARDVMASITPGSNGQSPSLDARPPVSPDARDALFAKEKRALSEPQHMSRLISLALADIMLEDDRVVVFGEDVGRKGGVYGATSRLHEKFGSSRVIDTLLDEQTILGLAIGLAHNGYVPIPEIQFLAYVHNAADQIRGEAATLSFFSAGQFANPMVIRVAGLAYQRGFGGHFHNDNAIGAFRDIPGVILACPSNGHDAVAMLRESVRLAREDGRVVIFLEPIALYGVKDLHDDGDGAMAALYPEPDHRLAFGAPGVEGEGRELSIVTYANGAFLSRRAARRLESEHGLSVRVIDIRWLQPLNADAVFAAANACDNILIVDECRRTGSVSEELMTAFVERGRAGGLARVTAEDSFIPLGPAAYEVLVSEDAIVEAALELCGRDAPLRIVQ